RRRSSMSTAPNARNPHHSRLLDDSYEDLINAGHLIDRRIPYVTADATVQYWILAYTVAVSGDIIKTQTDNRNWIGSTQPFHPKASPQQ
ncbi:hypothetical protein QN355_20140, partial [Cryobacterium sp. 10S3]|uniref:DUF6791 domain-containing protein n=1 Tax=Cryobacterium sp. 10S3 TaxID=3048582 RepID=UPI002B2323B2